MDERCLIDGLAGALVAFDDRGLAYGDGVFRTLRVTHGKPEAWAAHRARLIHDTAALAIEMPDEQALLADTARLFADGGSGVLKIMVTRGSGGRGYRPTDGTSRRIVSRHALPAEPDFEAIDLATSPVVLGHQPRLAGVKHLNRLEQVLASDHCHRQGLADALMCDGDAHMICTTRCNLLFMDAHGRWLTPSLARCGVAGATRARLMAGVASVTGVPILETALPLSKISDLRAGVACNSVLGIIAVASLSHRGQSWPLVESLGLADQCRRLLALQ